MNFLKMLNNLNLTTKVNFLCQNISVLFKQRFLHICIWNKSKDVTYCSVSKLSSHMLLLSKKTSKSADDLQLRDVLLEMLRFILFSYYFFVRIWTALMAAYWPKCFVLCPLTQMKLLPAARRTTTSQLLLSGCITAAHSYWLREVVDSCRRISFCPLQFAT